jgi:hypothetical protein
VVPHLVVPHLVVPHLVVPHLVVILVQSLNFDLGSKADAKHRLFLCSVCGINKRYDLFTKGSDACKVCSKPKKSGAKSVFLPIGADNEGNMLAQLLFEEPQPEDSMS